MIARQWDMIVKNETAYVVYATSAGQARSTILEALDGRVGYIQDLRNWQADGEPVREMGTAPILRRW